MSAGGFTVIDGTQLRSLSQPLALPTSDSSTVTGAQLLDFAENEASSSLFGLSLPQNLKSTALKHISGSDDDVTFRIKEFDRDHASKLASDYITAIADELKDDFTMLAENLFADLDTEDEGKVCKGEIQNALGHMGVEFGVPPFSEFPQLNDILKKHGAEGEEELGQAQFTELLRQVLQDIVDALADKHIIIIPNIKIIDGSKLRMDIPPDELPDQLPPMRSIQHAIDLVPGSQLPDCPHYRMNSADTVELNKQIQGLLAKNSLVYEAERPRLACLWRSF
ncbi:calcium-binding EF hand family protein [Citrus sinensis]|nr:calcium-binding EF hand family protein [Citrus sinensis]KAH9687913.1 calcium-binding EF hand family protein [Citrus sinensis]